MTDSDINNVWGVAVHETAQGECYVYVSVERLGVKVLKFNPSQGTLTEEGLIQTGWRPEGVTLRTKDGVTTLLVTDLGGGIRLYGE